MLSLKFPKFTFNLMLLSVRLLCFLFVVSHPEFTPRVHSGQLLLSVLEADRATVTLCGCFTPRTSMLVNSEETQVNISVCEPHTTRHVKEKFSSVCLKLTYRIFFRNTD